MSRKSNLSRASLMACTLSLLSSTSWAAMVTVHVPTPVVPPPVHISAPVISVKPPVAGVKLPVRSSIALDRGLQRLVKGGATTGRNWPGRNIGGAQTVSSSGVVVTQGSNGKTASPGVTVTQGSNRQTASPGNTVYSATTTSTGQNGSRNWPVQFGIPNAWPTQVVGTNVPPTEFWINNPIYSVYPGAVPNILLHTTAEQEAGNWFVGTTCSNQGGDDTLTIDSAGPVSGNSVQVSGAWDTSMGPPVGKRGERINGTITQNANGTYTLTFTRAGLTYTITLVWTPGPGGGYWTLTNGTVTNPANAQDPQQGTWSVGNCGPTP